MSAEATVAIMAATILRVNVRMTNDPDALLTDHEKRAARWAVQMARAIYAEVQRTEPQSAEAVMCVVGGCQRWMPCPVHGREAR